MNLREIANKAISYGQSAFRMVTGKYFIESYYLAPVPAGEIPVGTGHQYLSLIDGKTSFVTDPAKATCFDFVLAMQLIKGLKKFSSDHPGLEFSLVTVEDAAFIKEISQQ